MKNKINIAFILCSVIALLSVFSAVCVYAESPYKITYDYGAAESSPEKITNNNPSEYRDGEKITLTSPRCDGYDFKGWFFDPDYTVPASTVSDLTEDITLYAKWYESSYDIKYVLTCDNINIKSENIYNPNTLSRRFGETVYLDAPVSSDEYYVFVGWYLDPGYSRQITFIPEYTCGGVTLYALWKNAEYTVNYDLGDASTSKYPTQNPNADKYEYSVGMKLSAASAADPALTFEGWYFDEYFTKKAESIPSGTFGEVTLYAKWNRMSYPILYILCDGSGISENDIFNSNPDSYNGQCDVSLAPAVSDDKSFLFAGWYTSPELDEESRITVISSDMREKITLYAKWQTAVYDITYDLGIINPLLCKVENNNASAYMYGEKIELNDIYADGFIFNGWCMDKNYTSHITQLPENTYGNITLYADFTEKTYTVKYYTESAGIKESQIVNKNPTVRTTTERIVLEDLETINPLYTFAGWYSDSEFTQSVKRIAAYTAENITLYAKWIKIVSYLPVWGDASLSDQLSAADARLALRYSAKLESFNDLQLKVADVNNDGKVTAADARIILRLAAGLENNETLKQKYNLPDIIIEDGEIVFK